MKGLYLVVTDIEAARAELVGRGANIGEIFHRSLGEGQGLVPIRNAEAMRPSPRSLIPMATAGSSRR